MGLACTAACWAAPVETTPAAFSCLLPPALVSRRAQMFHSDAERLSLGSVVVVVVVVVCLLFSFPRRARGLCILPSSVQCVKFVLRIRVSFLVLLHRTTPGKHADPKRDEGKLKGRQGAPNTPDDQ